MPSGSGRQRTVASTSTQSRFAIRVGSWLAALAVIPLVGAAWFALQQVREVSAIRERAESLDDRARDLIVVSELRARLIDEKNWMVMSAGLGELGFSTPFIERLTDIDIDAEQAQAVVSVDHLFTELRRPDLEVFLDLARDDQWRTVDELEERYAVLEGQIEILAAEMLDGLVQTASSVSAQPDLVDALHVLQAASVARQSISSQLTAYFSAQFSVFTTAAVDIEELIAQRELHDRAVREIERVARPDWTSTATLADIAGSESFAVFDLAGEALVIDALSGDGFTRRGAAAAEVDADELTSVFEAGSRTADDHLRLLDAAGVDMFSEAKLLVNAADDRSAELQWVIGAVVAGSLLFTVGLTRAIGHPLRSLASAARQLRDGDTTRQTVTSGPREIQEATEAINEAAAHLNLVERQAMALAAGDLDHPTLTQDAPGALGSSLNEAVQTLAMSMSQREEFRRRLAHEATHDGLTQLPNRGASIAQLQKSLARTRRTGGRLAVIFVDLDGFKKVNDTEGHPAGDIVLKVIGQRLVTAVREGDHVGRLGGDEFVVVAEPVADATEAVRLGERLLATVSAPILVDTATVSVTASIGIAMADSSTELTADEVLRDSDLAVYKAKHEGRGRIELCDDELRAEVKERTRLERELRDAIELDELSIFYQPIVDPHTLEINSLEALLRWKRDDGYAVGPAQFIPLAERSELIVEIDKWVLDTVARQIAAWSDVEALRTMSVAVNVSARHLNDTHFVDNIVTPIRRHGIDPGRIVIEITESALVHDLHGAAVQLQALREHGFRIAIDDFGTGYTSLAHLKTLPFDILKIDRSFTGDPASQSLVSLIINTGHLLNVLVTAEGIESPAQAAALTRMGSDALQGFLYALPCPAEDLPSALAPLRARRQEMADQRRLQHAT